MTQNTSVGSCYLLLICRYTSVLFDDFVHACLCSERLAAPVFTESIADVTAVEGEPVSFRCVVTGKPLPRIKWYVSIASVLL